MILLLYHDKHPFCFLLLTHRIFPFFRVGTSQSQRNQEQQVQTEMERQRHNARMLPEDRPSANASSTSLESSPAPPPAINTPQAPQGNGPASNGILPLNNNATTAGNGPLPSGWGQFAKILLRCLALSMLTPLFSYHV